MKVSLRPGLKTVRHIPPPDVEVTAEMPLIDPKDPDHKQIQEIWEAKVRVFRLKVPDDVTALADVWQRICDLKSKFSENNTQWSAKDDNFVVMMRWADLSYVAPTI